MMIASFKKLTFAACGFLTGLALGSCEDNLTQVGVSIQPPGDRITVYTDTFLMTASTIRLDSIFAKTTNCMLGEMHDPFYGTIKSDFLCQFYCAEGFQFAETPHEGKIDSLDLLIFYPNVSGNRTAAYGDTLLPMQVSVYPLKGPLDRNFYTNDDPEKYCEMNRLLGQTVYTPYDMGITAIERAFVDLDGSNLYTPVIRIKLPLELGQQFYDESIGNPSTFASQNAFNRFFPGLYITNTFGSGNLIYTQGENISLRIAYHTMAKNSQGEDSVVYRAQIFRSAKDVVQINRFKNSHLDRLLEENPTYTYIKAPAGVCTKLVIPARKILNEMDLEDRFINNFTLNLKYLPGDEWDFAYEPPSHLLLLPEDSVKSFFENGYIENYNTSFVSFMYDVSGSTSYTSTTSSPVGYNPTTRTYSFGNISALLRTHIRNSPEKDLSVLLLPVNRISVNTSNNSNSYTYYTTGITHTLLPAGLKIRKEEEFMKIVLLSGKFEEKDRK
jgi:hypothetical protein